MFATGGATSAEWHRQHQRGRILRLRRRLSSQRSNRSNRATRLSRADAQRFRLERSKVGNLGRYSGNCCLGPVTWLALPPSGSGWPNGWLREEISSELSPRQPILEGGGRCRRTSGIVGRNGRRPWRCCLPPRSPCVSRARCWCSPWCGGSSSASPKEAGHRLLPLAGPSSLGEGCRAKSFDVQLWAGRESRPKVNRSSWH